ncbi:MAG: CheR family methyltransferase [Treponemataceae bacterium]
MNASVSRHAISDLSDYVRLRLGMNFPRERWDELEKKVVLAAESLGFEDAPSCIKWMLSSKTDKRQLEILTSCLTVGETYFYREAKSLQALTEQAFPEIIKAHSNSEQRVRIWCAGCSTGEEPYTIAMMVLESAELKGWEVSILGTDINQVSLKKAEDGIYTEWSFRGVDPRIKEKFFNKVTGTTFEIMPALKSMVTFAQLNLIDDVFPALINYTNAIDLILCRNVLMYLTPDYAQNVLRKFRRSLLPDGWLLVSPVEVPLVDPSVFTPLVHTGAVLHRKAFEKPEYKTRPPSKPTNQKIKIDSKPPEPKTERNRPAITFALAQAFYADADYNGAIEILSSLASRPPVEAAVFRLLTRAYANNGKLSEAERWCRRSIAAEKENAASRYLLALIKIEQQKPDDAISALRQAIYLEPDFMVAHFTLANIYRREKKLAESERHLKNTLKILRHYRAEEQLPESEGITAGNMIEMIAALRLNGKINA